MLEIKNNYDYVNMEKQCARTLNTQNKERRLKSSRQKHHVTYKGKPIRVAAGFSAETIKAGRARNNVFQALKENSCQSRLLCTAEINFINERRLKNSS
jgi:hypothetical protein